MSDGVEAPRVHAAQGTSSCPLSLFSVHATHRGQALSNAEPQPSRPPASTRIKSRAHQGPGSTAPPPLQQQPPTTLVGTTRHHSLKSGGNTSLAEVRVAADLKQPPPVAVVLHSAHQRQGVGKHGRPRVEEGQGHNVKEADLRVERGANIVGK